MSILADEELRDQGVEVRKVSDRMIAIKLILRGLTSNIISAYAPQTSLDEKVKRHFWEELDEVVRGIPFNEKIILGGDFNGHIRTTSTDMMMFKAVSA